MGGEGTARSRLSIVAGGRRPLRRCRWPLRGGGEGVFLGGGAEGEPWSYAGTQPRAHLPSFNQVSEAEGGWGPINRCL